MPCQYLKMACMAFGQKIKRQQKYKKKEGKNADRRRQLQHCTVLFLQKKCERKFGSRIFQFMKKLCYLNAV
jgi:hypothetical protein